ncbi:tyrosine-type recombinase/integrase [Paenibacillus herberti]|uniref:Site-specific integrase n=1 Tax=Paenibacillus herberti TaxID=1619309 RepID=A0A229P604_9BACL|nr:tyrosine-type recombinase/integrase [Paenibacillus herberti]OXM17355.1 site-specific integrase [Paenibacillus herberti]
MASFKKIPANNKQGYKWMCIKDGPADPATGARNQIKRRADTRKEAEARCDEAIRSLTEFGIDVKKLKNLTFEKVAEEWIESYHRTGVKKRTIIIRKSCIKTILRFNGQKIIDRVTPRDHQYMLNTMDDEGYSKSTIELVHVTANMIYKYAVKMKYRKDNPATGAVIPIRRRTVEEIENNPIEEKYLERHELSEFLEAVIQHGLKLDKEVFFTLTFGGMRMGELLAFKWTDLTPLIKHIRVTKTLFSEKNNMKQYELVPPKTNASIREFDLDELIIDMLMALKQKQEEEFESIRLVIKDFHDGNFIIRNDNGYPWTPKKLSLRLERILKKTKITKRVTSHIFRHTHISMLTEAGVPLSTIMQRVGHDDPKTTLKIYTHITEKMKKDAATMVSTSYEDILKGLVLQET